MELQEFVAYIKEARKRKFSDSIIKNSLLDKGWPLYEIENAFLFANQERAMQKKAKKRRAKPVKGSITILLEPWLKGALEKKAKKHNLTLYNEIKKILKDSIPDKEVHPEIKARTRIRPKLSEEEKKAHKKAQRRYKRKKAKKKRGKKKAKRGKK
jgi:hypothetical protein